MNESHAAEYVIPIGAQSVTQPIGSYKYVFFFFAPVSFKYSLDGTTFLTGYQGLQIGPFNAAPNITFQQGSAGATAVVIYAGNVPFAYYPNSMGIPTYPKGTVLAANVVLSGFDGLNIRKQLIVTNTTASTLNFITVKDANGVVFDTVQGGAAKTYVSGGAFTISAPGGSTGSIGELFYQLV